MRPPLTHIAIFTLVLAVGTVAGGAAAQAQSSAIQKAFEGVKGTLDNLLGAKDAGKGSELALRIETFKKVLEFAEAEAKELKVKLLALDLPKGDPREAWREGALEVLQSTLVHCREVREHVESIETSLSMEGIRRMAEEFRGWRGANVMPTINQIHEFLLTVQEENAIQVATKRLERIKGDMGRLERAKVKGTAELQKLLEQAEALIRDAARLNNEARALFLVLYVPRAEVAEPFPTSTPPEPPETGATSTQGAASAPEGPPPSIKDLVKDSLAKVREAYQVFIEMSNRVRRSLK